MPSDTREIASAPPSRNRGLITAALERLDAGDLPTEVESEHLDLKEEAGRRGKGGILLQGSTQSSAAAEHLADEVACMANTPGGGVLLLGVEDSSGDLIGTALDADWLRHRIWELVDVAPAISPVEHRGARLLSLEVAPSREPVIDTNNRIRWRVGGHCVPVDRSQWWLHQQTVVGFDAFAGASERVEDDVTPGAVAFARRCLLRGDQPDADLAAADRHELLTRIGALRPDRHLTLAGALLFCSSTDAALTWTRIDVPGGEVLTTPSDFSGLSVLEQVQAVEERLDAANDVVTLVGGFAEERLRELPVRAAREAVMNGVVHRDWQAPEPVAVTWTEADSALDVVSPGGFTGGVSEANVLVTRFSRSPALADLARALHLVDRQGLGVDRMVREMLTRGHRAPVVAQRPGPRVQTVLVGGRPVVPVLRLIRSIEPESRQRDVRVALVVATLLRECFAAPSDLLDVLQRDEAHVDIALDAVAACRVGEHPLVVAHKDVWVLSEAADQIVLRAGRSLSELKRSGVLRYREPDESEVERLVRRWLGSHDRITSGDLATLTGTSVPTARSALDRLVGASVVARGDAVGRNAHYRLP